MRALARGAGASLSSTNYHFGTKGDGAQFQQEGAHFGKGAAGELAQFFQAAAAFLRIPYLYPGVGQLPPGTADSQADSRSLGTRGLRIRTKRNDGRKMPAVAANAPDRPSI